MSNFEDDLKNMFDGAEFAPSEQLWTGIEDALKAKKKKGIFFYWQSYGVAAALALVLTFAYFFSKGPNQQPEQAVKTLTELKDKTASGKIQAKADSSENLKSIEPNEKAMASTRLGNLGQSLVDKKIEKVTSDPNKTRFVTSNELLMANQSNSLEEIAVMSMELNSDRFNTFAAIVLPQLPEKISIIKARWEVKHLVGPMEISSSDLAPEAKFERLLSLNGGMGSSSFDPNASGTSDEFNVAELRSFDPMLGSSAIVSSVKNENNQQLGSYAVGAGIGMALSPSWSLSMSLRYSEYRFAGESNAYSIEGQLSLPIYIPAGFQGDIVIVPNYQLTNSLTSLALPVQMAYKVLDLGRFDLEAKAGLSVDYFLSYKIKGDLPFLSTRKIDFSETSLFNRFNVGSTGGLGLNYELNPQWGLSADLFVRKYIGGFKEEGNFQSRPFIYGFSFNLRYFLRKDNN